MRSGVIAQKVGMTRVFTEAGEHVPVTVLKMENVQVLAHRTDEKNGYTALQLGAGTRKVEPRHARRAGQLRRGPGRAQAQAGRVPRQPRQRHRGGRRDHGRPLRQGPARGRDRHQPGQGLPGRHEALELRRLARHARRVGHPPQPRLHRPAPGPGQGLQGQEDGRQHGQRARHHAEPRGGRDRQGSRPRAGAGRGARHQGRLGAGARRRQALAAEGGAQARLVPQARRLPAGTPPPEAAGAAQAEQKP